MKDLNYIINNVLIDATIYDSYYYARRILSYHINYNFNLSLNDLPDTSDLTDISDSISDIIKDYKNGYNNINNAISNIQMILSDVDIDFIECQIYN